MLLMVPMYLASFLAVVMYIASSVLLLRERAPGPWLMLAGSVLSVVGMLASLVLQIYVTRVSGFNNNAFLAVASLSSLGALLFAIGLLLHALRQKAKANRVAELEGIIASLQNR